MAASLVDGLTDLFRSQGLGPFSAQSGESETSVLRGFQTSVGTMVMGLASKLGQTGFAQQFFDLVNSPANDTRILDDVRGVLAGGPDRPGGALGSRFLSMLFAGRQSTVTDAVSRASGLRSSSAASLVASGAPLLLGWLGKRVREGGMDASRLSGFLSQEATAAQSALPSEVTTLFGAESKAPYATVPPVAQGVIRQRSTAWLWPLVAALVALVFLLGWLARRQPIARRAPTLVLLTRRLPDNVALRIPANRMEDHLLAFVQDPSRPVDETTWFDFDRLLFDTNSATLQPASQDQLRNVAEILKAYPNVHARIGGYTDNTGDPAANQTLSQQRAEGVRQQLIAMGTAPDRLEAQGYGDQHPVADNSTPEGRQQNRRISLRVTQK